MTVGRRESIPMRVFGFSDRYSIEFRVPLCGRFQPLEYAFGAFFAPAYDVTGLDSRFRGNDGRQAGMTNRWVLP